VPWTHLTTPNLRHERRPQASAACRRTSARWKVRRRDIDLEVLRTRARVSLRRSGCPSAERSSSRMFCFRHNRVRRAACERPHGFLERRVAHREEPKKADARSPCLRLPLARPRRGNQADATCEYNAAARNQEVTPSPRGVRPSYPGNEATATDGSAQAVPCAARTFDMSGGRRQLAWAGGRPLDGGLGVTA
jgi:hypothetical protein